MASRFARYLRRLFRIGIVLAILALILVLVQLAFHPFDALLEWIGATIADLEAKLSHELFNGITLGSLALILGLCIFPIFLKRIDEKAYVRGLWRGTISAAVFYLSNRLFLLATQIGRVPFLLVMLAVIIATTIVIEGVSLAVREEEERSFRTDVVASITSGLLFGVLVKVAQFGIELLKKGA